ncbi:MULTISPECIES: hypothetical protein [Chromobacterium]|uniref:Secreted protein n=1 Tax=Chromobacterium aquaticum TaxID=467180 RepID=A0ABV8ZMC2_9NEIS|nr:MULTISPECIES: hypothetical protein [Chromobacterium]MCD5362844.1 hypothetical protein [Chromobacterium aquaticum]
MTVRKFALLVAGLSVSWMAFASMAPWYLWESKSDGHLVCSQFSYGPGWVLLNSIPYKDAGCRVQGRPG